MVNKLRLLFFLTAGLFLLACLVITLYHLAYLNKIYPFVFVGPNDVSNLTVGRAEVKINDSLPQSWGEINLTFDGQTWPVSLENLEISYDSLASAQKAYLLGRSGNFFGGLVQKWRQWRRQEKLPLVMSLNEDRLSEAITAIVIGLTEEPIQPALIAGKKGTAELYPGKNGQSVDQEQLNQKFKENLSRLDFSSLEIPVNIASVDISPEQLAATQQLGQKIISKKLIIVYEDFSQKVVGQELLDLIDLGGGFNQENIASLSARLAQSLDRPSQNATFQFDSARVIEFKPALPGRTLDQTLANQLILNALNSLAESADDQTVDLIVDTQAPATALADVNTMGIKELLGKGESTFKGSIPGRRHNIALASGRINGLLVAPGETFSFNQMVGDISKETGYQPAYIIQGGRTVLGDGGGVCQVSTTLFRAVLNAGLEIVERRAHAYRVGYYEQNSPAGLDATVFSPSVDFKFKNDTANHLLIQATVDNAKSYLKFELYGSGDGRRATITNPRLWSQTPPPPDLYVDDPALPAGQIKQIDWKAFGAKAAFDWLVMRGEETLHQKTFYSSYQPWQAVFLRGTGGT